MTMQNTPDRDLNTALQSTQSTRSTRLSRILPLAFGLALATAAPMQAAQAETIRAHGPAQQAAPQQAAPQQAAPQQATPQAGSTGLAPVTKTEIKSQTAYERLLNNSGVSVQWLWSAERGHLNAKDVNDVVRIDGTQANFEGTLKINGEIVSIDKDRFTFRGTILILDAPDKGRRCERTGDYEFRATGKRKYWRLQQMESCDRLTDYVDIFY